MGGTDGAYAIDLDGLDEVIADIEACERELERLTTELSLRIRELQGQWDGLTATAQREAHQQWEQGMDAMRVALVEMRSAARVAHGNYALAISTNLDMWADLA